jgi:hypothetical protein
MQTESEMLWVADDASGKPPLQLKGRRGLASPKRAVDPDQHDDDSTWERKLIIAMGYA